MKLAIAALLVVLAAGRLNDADQSCLKQDQAVRAKVQTKLAVMGVECEEMCKRVGAYPNCQCAGFDGAPAEDSDTRACLAKWCQDPAADRKCPNDDFVNCVKQTTGVSTLQWPTLLHTFDNLIHRASKAALVSVNAHAGAAANASSCDAVDRENRALIQSKVASLGPVCEEICKKMDIYPNCQCPGFAGQPASDFDTRACFAKWCQDPAFDRKCPNDDFVGCVEGTTSVSVLQWPTLLKRMSRNIKMVKAMLQTPPTKKTNNTASVAAKVAKKAASKK